MQLNFAQTTDGRRSPDERLTLENVELIDGTGAAPLADATVVVAGSRIVYAGPATPDIGSGVGLRCPLPGKTVIPGLIEAHTHSSFDADMLAYVRNGVTALRFAGLDQRDVAKLK